MPVQDYLGIIAQALLVLPALCKAVAWGGSKTARGRALRAVLL